MSTVLNTTGQTGPTPTIRPLPDSVVSSLKAVFNSRFTSNASVCLLHGTDESAYAPRPPQAVVFAESTDEVSFIVRSCAAHRIPVIPFGVGSSVEGHLLAIKGGICIDMSRMNAIVDIRPDDLTATVQAGVTREQLNEDLVHTGFFFSVDPGANASIGGMVATAASGTNTVRYGTMRDNVLSLTVVTADGEVIRTARRARKSSAGYCLTQLFIGSEGTLTAILPSNINRAHPLASKRSSCKPAVRPRSFKSWSAVISFPRMGWQVDCRVKHSANEDADMVVQRVGRLPVWTQHMTRWRGPRSGSGL